MSTRKGALIISTIVVIVIILLIMAKPWTERMIYFKNAHEILQKR